MPHINTAEQSTVTSTIANGTHSPYRKPKKWTLEKCIAEASKYTSISEWAANSDSSYRAAKRYEWMEHCTSHMTKFPNWNRQKCLSIVKSFSKIADWKKNSSESYRYAESLGEAFLSECKKIIAKNNNRTANRRWTKEAVLKEAKKYKTATEWHAKGGGSYRKAKAEGWWDEATAHMSTPERPKKPYKWTRSKCKKEAAKYTSKEEWAKGSPSSYRAADAYGYMDECLSKLAQPATLH